MCIREVHGVLGRDVRAKLPDCMERFIKLSFSNEYGTDYVDFAEADAHEWTQATIIVILKLWCLIIYYLILNRHMRADTSWGLNF